MPALNTKSSKTAPSHAVRLLAWYDQHARALPWRMTKGAKPDPYRVWLSEIMLQQTTVAAVTAYYEKFLRLWPDVHALAGADLDDLLKAWAGLGYYARARNLKKCAEIVAGEMGGVFPSTQEGLLQLPGIGPYTAAAIAAIAFDVSTVVVDGNVERVVARKFKVETPLPKAKKQLYELAARISPGTRSGDYAQAMMDLGATICTPRNPRCEICPVSADCAAAWDDMGDGAADYPKRAPKQVRPKKSAHVYWLEHDGRVMVRRRPERGLLGGLLEFPTSPWREGGADIDAAAYVPMAAKWVSTGARIRHVFTHFELELHIHVAKLDVAPNQKFEWRAIGDLEGEALPTLMKKVARSCTT